MKTDCISFRKTNYFSKLINDYLDEKESLKPFYNRFPSIENFEGQLQEKSINFPSAHRTVLVKALKEQYTSTTLSKTTKINIDRLADTNTFTVVTGHQLNLFTGPLYFLYKIISTINLAKELKQAYPDNNFVPVYWMATEDHDFEEINYFNFNGKKIHWNREASGAVGHLHTDGLDTVLDTFVKEMGGGKRALELKRLFSEAYLEHDNLTDATRYLANALFGDYGLVIVDGDHTDLKRLLIPHIQKDLFANESHAKVTETIKALQALPEGYGIQVNPREINYFYLVGNIRERIIEKEGVFYVNDTEITFTKASLLEELEAYPERFSPNVITRPLYQEWILPNLCYIGGGGELAYWMELKTSFEAAKVTFPILLLRNSALIIARKQANKGRNLNINFDDFFLKQDYLVNKKVKEISDIDINFSKQRTHLENQFKEMYQLAEQTDASFLGAVKAQEKKQMKGLNALEKRLLKAQKRKLKDQVDRLTHLQSQLFPNGSLQERYLNFSELYLEYGDNLILELIHGLKPLSGQFSILEMDK